MKVEKKIFIFALLATCILILIYINNTNTKEYEMISKMTESTLTPNNFSDISMSLENLDNTKITVRINSSANDSVIFGEDYIIEAKNGQRWYTLPINKDIMFNSIGYELKKGASFLWSTDYDILYGKLSPGKYRMIKSFRVEPPQGKPKDYFVSVEFTV